MTIIFTNNFYKENTILLYNLDIYKSFHKKAKIFQSKNDLIKFFNEINNIYLFYVHLIFKINSYCKNKNNRKKVLEYLKFIKDLNHINEIFHPNKNNSIHSKSIIDIYNKMFKYQNTYNVKKNIDNISKILTKFNDSSTTYNDFLNKENNKRIINEFIRNDELDLEKYRNDYKKSIDLLYSTSKLNKNLLFSCVYINLINIDQLLNIFEEFLENIDSS